MKSTSEEMHPNWGALATIHLPLKRFVSEGFVEKESGRTKGTDLIHGVSGEEASKFYNEIIRTDRVVREFSNKKRIEKPMKTNTNVTYSVPFERNNYFIYAMSNNAIEIKKINFVGADDINARDEFGWTTLMMAACEGALEVVATLLELGVDRHVKDRSGRTALDLACKKGYLEIADLLRQNTIETDKDFAEARDNTTTLTSFYCTICQHQFSECTRREHDTSTVHTFNEKCTPTNKLQKFNISPKNRGLQLMVKQGWDKESGLGPSHSGRLYPVKTVIRKQKTGLGIEQPPARVTHFEAFDLRATQRHFTNRRHRTRNDMIGEKKREWKRERRLRNELS